MEIYVSIAVGLFVIGFIAIYVTRFRKKSKSTVDNPSGGRISGGGDEPSDELNDTLNEY